MPNYKPCGCLMGYYCEHGTTEDQLLKKERECPHCGNKRTTKINEFSRACGRCKKTYIIERLVKRSS